MLETPKIPPQISLVFKISVEKMTERQSILIYLVYTLIINAIKTHIYFNQVIYSIVLCFCAMELSVMEYTL